MTIATPLYRDVIWAIRKQIKMLGLTLEQCDELSGNQSGYTGKMLEPDTPSGRQAGWNMLQNLCDAIFAGDVRVKITPVLDFAEIRANVRRRLAAKGHELALASYVERMRRCGVVGKMPIRDHAALAAPLGGRARAEQLTPKQRSAIARMGGKARWKKPNGLDPRNHELIRRG